MTHCFGWIPAWSWLLLSWHMTTVWRKAFYSFDRHKTEWIIIFEPLKPFRFISMKTDRIRTDPDETLWFGWSFWLIWSSLLKKINLCLGGFYACLLFVLGNNQTIRKKDITHWGTWWAQEWFYLESTYKTASKKNVGNRMKFTITIFVGRGDISRGTLIKACNR